MSGLMAANGDIRMKVALTGRVSQGPTEKSTHIYKFSMATSYVCLLAVTLVSGCAYVTTDSICRFNVEGSVRLNSDEPLAGVSVQFVDVGLDQWRRSTHQMVPVAVSNSKGRVSERFTYGWGTRYRKGGGRPHEPGAFNLVFVLDGFEEITEAYTLADLPSRDNPVGCHRILNFDVVMRKIP